MEPGDVQAFVDRTRETIADAPAMGLRNTQLRVVEPFLSLLGWDVRSSAVEAAYETPDGAVVDYALVPADRPGAFVSVVACEDSLTPAGRDELVDAMRAADVERGVYTNGREYLFVALNPDGSTDTTHEGGGRSPDGTQAGGGAFEDEEATDASEDEEATDASEAVADSGDGSSSSAEQVRVPLESLPDRVDALSALSFESVAASVAPDERRAAMALIEADDAAVAAVTEAVVDVAGEDVESEVEPIARKFLAAVVEELGPPEAMPGATESTDEHAADSAVTQDESGTDSGSTPAAGEHGDGDAGTTQSGPGSGAPDVTRAGQSRQTESAGTGTDGGAAADGSAPGESTSMEPTGESGGEYVVRFFDSSRSVGAVGNPNVDSAVQQAVEYLLGERGLGRRLQFPYTPGSSDTAFLHREPEHPDGRAMEPVRNLGGLYLYTGEDVATKRERVETLAERVGLRVMFSGDWA